MGVVQQTVSQRKIQKLGGSSLIITIPKTWARRMGLKPGDNVIIVDDGDSLRILPPSKQSNGASFTVKIKYNSIIKTVSLSRITYCAFVFGYRRMIVESIQGLREELVKDIESLERELGDVIENISINGSNVVIEFKENVRLDRTRLIKEVNTAVQNILDLVDFKIRLKENVEIAFTEKDALKTYASLMRSIIYESSSLSTRMASDIIAASIINLILQMAVVLLELSPPSTDLEASQIIGKLKLAVSEAFGGLASGSTKRASNAIEVADEIIKLIQEKKDGNVYYGIIFSLALAVRQLALKAICQLSMTK